MKLTEEIILHIFNNLGITVLNKLSIMNEVFSLGKLGDYSLYGAEATISNSKISIACVDLDDEFSIVVKLDGAPSYGCQLALTETPNPLIGTLLNNKWIEANVFIQATFLAGMEHMKQEYIIWKQLNDRKIIEELEAFIDYHDRLFGYEDEDEG